MDRTTSFVVGALTCMVAGASFVTMHLGDAGAADECLAAPKKASSPGQHWYYRIDRATQRHCWYLGDEGKAISRAAKPASERRATLTESDRGAALARSAANVHAEMPMPQMSRDDDAKVASVTPVVSAAPDSGSAAQGASRDAASEPAKQPDVWRALDAASSQGATSEPPKPASSAASVAPADATPDARNEPDAAPSAPTGAVAAPAFTPPPSSVMPPVQASRMEAPAMGRATSLSALFLAAFGALVFVTLATASPISSRIARGTGSLRAACPLPGTGQSSPFGFRHRSGCCRTSRWQTRRCARGASFIAPAFQAGRPAGPVTMRCVRSSSC